MSNDSDWIEWNGGENPAGFSKVEYRRRDKIEGMPKTADRLDWEHINHPGDIIAYRVVKP